MLRGEHVMARLQGGRLVPHRLSPEDGRVREVAGTLCGLYAAHEGGARRRLEEELAATEEELGPRLDPRRGFKVVRALAKLLEERAAWVSPTESDPYTMRTRIFELAAALPEPPASEPGLLGSPTREDLLSRVAEETGQGDPAAVMYADRRGAQLLGEFDEPSPEELVDRYNTAQVQAVLYSARDLTVELGRGADARLVFRYVKLLGLIFDLEETDSGYRLRLDGPLSLFGSTRKYGLRLAKFLPGLLLTAPWRLRASVEWKGRETELRLDSESCGLGSHYRDARDAGEEDGVREAFVKAWERAKDTGGWELEEGPGVLPFPEKRTALVPDFTLRHTGTGERAHLEILGFWSERQLVERVALLRESRKRGDRVLIAASQNLGTSPDTLSEAAGGEVVSFKNRLDPRAVLAGLEPGS